MDDSQFNTESDWFSGAQTVRTTDKRKDYERIAEELQDQRAYGEIAAKEHAKEALEELYHSEFPIDDPPESFERYEAELSLRALRVSVEELRNIWGDTTTYVVPPEGDIREYEVEDMPDRDEVHEAVTNHHIEIAKDTLDVMATYGQLAESHIAALSQRELPSEVRQYAIATLAELREENDEEVEESLSLREAIGRWLLS